MQGIGLDWCVLWCEGCPVQMLSLSTFEEIWQISKWIILFCFDASFLLFPEISVKTSWCSDILLSCRMQEGKIDKNGQFWSETAVKKKIVIEKEKKPQRARDIYNNSFLLPLRYIEKKKIFKRIEIYFGGINQLKNRRVSSVLVERSGHCWAPAIQPGGTETGQLWPPLRRGVQFL